MDRYVPARIPAFAGALDIAFIVPQECRCRVKQAETIHPTLANHHPGLQLPCARRRLMPL